MTEPNATDGVSISKGREFPVIDAGTHAATYVGYKPFKEDGQWGHKEGIRLTFQILKGPFAGKFASFKGNYFQDESSGSWFVGSRSKLANAIRTLTNGGETLTKAHDGTKVFITTEVKTSKNTGNPYSVITNIMPMPSEYDTQPAQQPQRQPAQQPQRQPAQQAPAKPAPQAAQTQTANTAQPKNDDLLDELSDLSDFK